MTAQTAHRVDTLSRDELTQIQSEKLRLMLEEIYGQNYFYTKKLDDANVRPQDISTLDDLGKLPFTIKSELAADQDRDGFAANLTYPLERYIRFHQTSGTTGRPLRVLDTPESWDWWGGCWARGLAGTGITAEDRIFCAFSFGPFIGFWASVVGARQIGALLVPGGGRSSIDRLHLMRESGCTVLCSTPTYALHLLEVAREQDFDLNDLKIHTTVHAGEPGANVPATKKRIESGWSACCYDHAGASEIGAFGFETQGQRNHLSIIETEFIAEIIDPVSGEPATEGNTGELVLTNLGRWGFPVIRYRTGDVVTVPPSTSIDAGFMSFDGGIIGRSDDMVTVRGVNVFPSAIDNFVRKFPAIGEYRVCVDKSGNMDTLEIEIELAEGSDKAAVPSALMHSIASDLGLRPEVRTVSRGTLPHFEEKAKRFHVKSH
jgi:phenylacetate-CoA ligase